jgi:hypothetical protein
LLIICDGGVAVTTSAETPPSFEKKKKEGSTTCNYETKNKREFIQYDNCYIKDDILVGFR